MWFYVVFSEILPSKISSASGTIMVRHKICKCAGRWYNLVVGYEGFTPRGVNQQPPVNGDWRLRIGLKTGTGKELYAQWGQTNWNIGVCSTKQE